MLPVSSDTTIATASFSSVRPIAALPIERPGNFGPEGEISFGQEGQEGLSPEPLKETESLLRMAQLDLLAHGSAVDISLLGAKSSLCFQ